MAALSVQNIALTGLVASLAAAAGGGDTFVNPFDQRTFLVVDNGSESSVNVTITAQKTSAKVPGVGGITVADKVVAVAAGEQKWIGPFPDAYNDDAGLVHVAYSVATDVTVGAVRMPKAD